MFSQRNLDFSEPLGFSSKTERVSGAGLTQLELSETQVGLRDARKTRGSQWVGGKSCVQ